MSKEDQQLLENIRDYKPPTELHPIAMHAWNLYEDNEFQLPPSAIETLREVFKAYGDDLQALGEAMFGLTRFMLLVTEHHNDKVSADKIAELMREFTHLYEPFWESVGEALTNVGSQTRSVFQQFMGVDEEQAKTAPTFGEAAPADSIPLKDLLPPSRPPAWKPKK